MFPNIKNYAKKMFPNIKNQTKHLSTTNGEALTAPLHLSYKTIIQSSPTLRKSSGMYCLASGSLFPPVSTPPYPIPPLGSPVTLPVNRSFKGLVCYQFHLREGRSNAFNDIFNHFFQNRQCRLKNDTCFAIFIRTK